MQEGRHDSGYRSRRKTHPITLASREERETSLWEEDRERKRMSERRRMFFELLSFFRLHRQEANGQPVKEEEGLIVGPTSYT